MDAKCKLSTHEADKITFSSLGKKKSYKDNRRKSSDNTESDKTKEIIDKDNVVRKEEASIPHYIITKKLENN